MANLPLIPVELAFGPLRLLANDPLEPMKRVSVTLRILAEVPGWALVNVTQFK